MRQTVAAMLLLAWAALPLFAAEPGLQQLIAECDRCHGTGGVSTNPYVPIIAGQAEPLISKAHEQFKDWRRPCTSRTGGPAANDMPATSMCTVSESLDTGAIDTIANYYASLEFTPADQAFDADKAVQGAALHQMYCESCHPEGGSEAGFAGRLAGQWIPYLQRTLEQIERDEVQVPHIMEHKVADFSDEEIEALLNYWASQQE